jgi:aspartate/glutamate racemase
MPRIALIHATALAVEPIREAFARLWPEARTTNLLDDSLSADLAASGTLDAAMIARFETLARYVENCGANAILFTCSAFGAAIDAAAKCVKVPVLKPNEAMLEEALEAGSRIGIVATFLPTIPSMVDELQALARSHSRTIDIETRHVPGAMDALAAGKGEDHDHAIAAALPGLAQCDAVLLSQFSMAQAAQRARAVLSCPVLTSPDSAVRKLRRVLD